jgi:cation diffusion facilitator CzcD-associated flavoprotein CzcO
MSFQTADQAALGCKRPAFDAGWLDSLNQDNVHLTNSAIIGITKDSVETADGQSIKADILIFATGSDVAEHGVGLNVNLRGEKGLELQTFWKDIGGPQAYLGIAVPKVRSCIVPANFSSLIISWSSGPMLSPDPGAIQLAIR